MGPDHLASIIILCHIIGCSCCWCMRNRCLQPNMVGSEYDELPVSFSYKALLGCGCRGKHRDPAASANLTSGSRPWRASHTYRKSSRSSRKSPCGGYISHSLPYSLCADPLRVLVMLCYAMLCCAMLCYSSVCGIVDLPF